MRRTVRMGAAVAVLAVFMMTGSGCRLFDLNDVKVPENFDWMSTGQDVTVKVNVVSADGAAIPNTEVVVAATKEAFETGGVIADGITDEQGLFEVGLRVPARFTELYVQASPAGVTSGKGVSIVNNEVSVSFGQES